MSVKNDRLLNAAQGDSIISALQAIATTPKSPYNNLNKLDPDYIDYDSTHASITQPAVDALNYMTKITYDNDGYIGVDYDGLFPPPTVVGSGNDVRFIDYDGTVLYTYSAADFANLTPLPPNPTHAGLTAQGWNWSLADAKAFVAEYGKLDIGQMYTTSDGKTRIYIKLIENRTSPVLQLYLNNQTELDIDWGDNSTHSTWTTTDANYVKERHNYPAVGQYTIAITVINGSFTFKTSSSSDTVNTLFTDDKTSNNSSNRTYLNSIQKIEMGNNTSIGTRAFLYCTSLASITIPNTVTSIGYYSFCYNYALEFINIPNSVTNISGSAFSYCTALIGITIPNSVTTINTHAFDYCRSMPLIILPETVTIIDESVFFNCLSLSCIIVSKSLTSINFNAFGNCYSLSRINIPNTVNYIGNEAFNSCYSLSNINIPNTCTTIESKTCYNCNALKSITIPSSITTINNYVFYGCHRLSSVTVPSSVTSIGTYAFNSCAALTSVDIANTTITAISNYTFGNCSSLSTITIPNTVTSIGNNAFANCYSLSFIIIPAAVTDIGTNAFQYCSAMSYIRFEPVTPPTVAGSNAWSNVARSTVIYVPALVSNLYMNGTNYPSKTNYKYIGYATYASGTTLPTVTTDETHSLTWYATSEDAIAQTNPITQGNGNEVYSVATAI